MSPGTSRDNLKQPFRSLHACGRLHCEGIRRPRAALDENVVLDYQVVRASCLVFFHCAAAVHSLVVPIILHDDIMHWTHRAPLEIQPHGAADDDIVMGVEESCAQQGKSRSSLRGDSETGGGART